MKDEGKLAIIVPELNFLYTKDWAGLLSQSPNQPLHILPLCFAC